MLVCREKIDFVVCFGGNRIESMDDVGYRGEGCKHTLDERHGEKRGGEVRRGEEEQHNMTKVH